MRSFRNNHKRSRFRSNGDRSFKRNGENQVFSVNSNFQRKSPGKNNHNAPKLIEKYNDLAREALANEDKILSENYFQHADHFTRVQNEQENLRTTRVNSSSTEIKKTIEPQDKNEKSAKIEAETVEKIIEKKPAAI